MRNEKPHSGSDVPFFRNRKTRHQEPLCGQISALFDEA
jgi:hypothetical protein